MHFCALVIVCIIGCPHVSAGEKTLYEFILPLVFVNSIASLQPTPQEKLSAGNTFTYVLWLLLGPKKNKHVLVKQFFSNKSVEFNLKK